MSSRSDYVKNAEEVKKLANSVENITLGGQSVFGAGKKKRRAASKSKSPKRSRKTSRSPKGTKKTAGKRKRSTKKASMNTSTFADSLIRLGVQLKQTGLTGAASPKHKKKAHKLALV